MERPGRMSRERGSPVRAARMGVLTSGQVFAGRYLIERLLGTGRASQVFAAFDLVDDRKVAIKVFDPHVLPSAGAARRFELAMRTSRELNGAHIATAIDAGIDGATHIPFIVTPLLSGETPEEAVRRRGPLAAGEGLRG